VGRENNSMYGKGSDSRNIPIRTAKSETRIGVFVIMGILAVVSMLYLLTDPATFRGRYKVTTNVTDVMGLRKGDPIQMRGVPIGRVHDFNLQPESDEVTVILEVEGKWRIPMGSTARLVSTGLMDPRTVEIVPGMGPGEIGEGAVLPGSVAKSIFDDTESLGEKGLEVLEKITTLLSDSTIQSVDGGTRYLESVLKDLSSIMDSESEKIRELISSLSDAAGELAAGTPELKEEVLETLEQSDVLIETLRERAIDLDETIGSLSLILERINRGEGTLGKLATNDELFDRLSETLESAKSLMDDLRENPSRYINISIF